MRDDSGPAFPFAALSGMTLRDYFAAHAPQPPDWWMKCYAADAQDLATVASVLAQWRHEYADAMLKERAK
jgi:hypothetical protein